MSLLLPQPLILFAGVVALWPMTFALRRPISAPRLLGEAFVTSGAMIAMFWLSWVSLWFIEQRW